MSGMDFGGKMTVTSSRGYKLALRGTINVLGTGSSNESITNQNGSVDRIMTPMARSAEITFRDDGDDWNDRLNGPRENITIVEEKTGVTHLFTGAFWSGRPSVNRLNGEMTGMQIVADSYQRLG